MNAKELAKKLQELITNSIFSREDQQELLDKARYFNSTLSDDPPDRRVDEPSNNEGYY